MAEQVRPWPMATGITGGIAFLLVGWCGLLVPSLIRSIEATYDRSDAEFGVYYLAVGLAYAAGSFGGGLATERVEGRLVEQRQILDQGDVAFDGTEEVGGGLGLVGSHRGAPPE